LAGKEEEAAIPLNGGGTGQRNDRREEPRETSRAAMDHEKSKVIMYGT